MTEAVRPIYVVYAPPDRNVVLSIRARLEEAGLGTVADVDLSPDEPPPRAVADAMDGAGSCVVFVGAGRIPPLELRELNQRAARDGAFLIVPALLPGADTGSLPPLLASRSWIDFRKGVDDSAAVASLVDALRGHDVEPLVLSPSVRGAVDRLPGDVAAAALAWQILSVHSEYAGGRARSVRLPDREAEVRMPGRAWLEKVRTLFNDEHVAELHGRIVILGLALLDETLREGLEQDGFLQALREELKEPLAQIVTVRGAELLAGRGPAPVHEETVPTHTDNPAVVDELGRKGFAKILARRIRDMRAEEIQNAQRQKDKKARRGGSFLVHLHAPWGAGKTSLLNFLADELHTEDPDRWVVVKFNAWRHQRIVPPWWWLMTTMYSEVVRELGSSGGWRGRVAAAKVQMREWTWRLRGGWPGYAMLLVATALLVVVWKAGFLAGIREEKTWSLETAKGFLLAAAAIATPVLTLWGVLRGVSRWVFATSARGARRFIDNTRDPMQIVQEHVKDLAYWIDRNVVVLVDDLDRCKAPYVVELLEGIQTLFREIPVAYVVAADRDWLSDSYASEYRKFVSAADEPGRPLGYLFLEKTFQISATLPPAGGQLPAYWKRLLHSASLPTENELEEARVEAQSERAGKSPHEYRASVASDPGSTPAQIQARRETVAVELASERAAHEAAHALQPFGDLLGADPNPRAMKRLVNAYGIARGAETLRGHNVRGDLVEEQRTALWTILSLRWPKLADHLAKHPDDVTAIGNGKAPPDVPRDLRPLFNDEDVVAVVHGDAEGVVAELDGQVVKEYVKPSSGVGMAVSR